MSAMQQEASGLPEGKDIGIITLLNGLYLCIGLNRSLFQETTSGRTQANTDGSSGNQAHQEGHTEIETCPLGFRVILGES